MSPKKLHFIDAYPLDQERRRFFTESKGEPYPSKQTVIEGVTYVTELWNKYDSTHHLLEEIATLTKGWPERSLECFVFGKGMHAMSTPFLLPLFTKDGTQRSDEDIIDLIIHELLHIFISNKRKSYWQMIRAKYSEEDVVVTNHILLYAMMCDLYNRLFEKEPIDFGHPNLSPAYQRAIDIVRETGPTHIIEEYWEHL